MPSGATKKSIDRFTLARNCYIIGNNALGGLIMRKIRNILVLGLIASSSLLMTGCELDEAVYFLDNLLTVLYKASLIF
jgi:hypothetical protein